MRLVKILYERRWEKISKNIKECEPFNIYSCYNENNLNDTVFVYHYWFVFDDRCIHFSPLTQKMSLCEYPEEKVNIFPLTSDINNIDLMHISYCGACLENIIYIEEAENLCCLCFKNSNIIMLELFEGTIMEPVLNPYWILSFYNNTWLRKNEDIRIEIKEMINRGAIWQL